MPAPRVIVIQHVAHEPLGTLQEQLKASALRMRYVNFERDPDARPTLDGYDGLIVLGGAMCLRESEKYPHLEYEIELIREAIRRDVPVLGICLGAQLIARALGGTVSRNPVKEIGWHAVEPTEAGQSDVLLQHFDDVEQIFQWHGDTFTLPEGAVHLARSATCENQAFRYGDKVYALQFHLEVDEQIITRWFRTPALQRDLETLSPQLTESTVAAETQLYMPRSLELSEFVFGEFLQLFGDTHKRTELPSK